MRGLTDRHVAVAAVPVAAVALALLFGGCAADQPGATVETPVSTGRAVPTVSPPVDPELDYTDPTAVCLRFAGTVYRHDTRVDASAQDAYRRATAYATADLVAALAGPPDARDPRWQAWREYQVVTDPVVAVAAVDGDARPDDTNHQAYRAAQVRVVPVGADGWRGTTETHLVLCTLRSDPGGWRVERYESVPIPDEP